MFPLPDNLQIEDVSPQRIGEVLRLLRSRMPDATIQQLITMLNENPSSNLLLKAMRDQNAVGAVFSNLSPGKIASVWTPVSNLWEPISTATRLLQALSDRLKRRGVCLATIMTETVSTEEEEIFHASGFDPLARLFYMVSLQKDFPAEKPPCELDFESYSPKNHTRLSAIVESTYEQTYDCPELNGIRKIEDVLEGYRSIGTFNPARWLIVQHQNRDVGCLLLADHIEGENFELVYMGLSVSARGHGWGAQIARHAQWLTIQAGRPRLILQVDAGNIPAMRTYSSAGFRIWEQRSAYHRLFI